MPRNSREYAIHKNVCDFLRFKYPKVLFNSDMSGLNLSIAQAGQAKMLRSDRGYPDLVIYEAKNGFHGLFIELKKEGTKLFKKNGEMVSDKHIQEQARMIRALRIKGYKAGFAVGIDAAIEMIDNYLTGK